jgi:hypothetical protein
MDAHKQKGYHVYTFNVKDGRNGHDDACLIAHYHAQAPKPQRRGLDRG